MKTPVNSSTTFRRSLLAVTMLAVLLLSIALAWWLVVSKDPRRPGETWYLLESPAGQPVGWAVHRHGRNEGRGEAGYELVLDGQRGLFDWRMWELTPQDTHARYMAARTQVRGPQRIVTRTFVQHKDGQVSVWTGLPRQGQLVQRRSADESFVPGGRLWARVVETARRGEAFTGTTVLDSANVLVPLHIRPLEQGEQLATTDERPARLAPVLVQLAGRQEYDVYYVTPDAQVPLIETYVDDRLVQRRRQAPLDELRRRFPDPGLDPLRLRSEVWAQDWPDWLNP